MKKALGVFLVALPFLAILSWITYRQGWRAAVWAFCATALVVVPIMIGVNLLNPKP